MGTSEQERKKPIKIKRPNALHRATHTPKGKKIPLKKVEKAAHSKNPRVRKEAQFDLNFDHHGSKK